MKVIIPLAGLGSRLRPHTHTKAKPLVYVAGNTVLGHILDDLEKRSDIEELIFITGYLGNQIEEYVESNYSFKTKYVVQKKLSGQATAIKLAHEFIKDGDEVLIWFVDTISDANLDNLKNITGDGAIYLKEVRNPRRFGQVKSETDGTITKIKEKADPPISNLVNIGIYYIKNSKLMFECIDEIIKKDVQTKGEYFLMDAFDLMIRKGAKFSSIEVNVWEDCGKPDALLQTNRYFLDNGKSRVMPTKNSLIIPPVFLDEGVEIENSIIGPHVSIAKGAKITNSIIKNSIIGEKSDIDSANIHESLVGDSAILKGNTKKINIGDSSEIFY